MRTTLAALALALTLAACQDRPAPPEPSDIVASGLAQITAALPKCSDIWQVGKKLPADYDSCKSADGTMMATIIMCDGVTLYEDEDHDGRGYYTTPDRVIHGGGTDYADDPHYQKVLADNC